MKAYLVFMTLALLVVALGFPLVGFGVLWPRADTVAWQAELDGLQAELGDWYAGLETGGTGAGATRQRLEALAARVDALEAGWQLERFRSGQMETGLRLFGLAVAVLATGLGLLLWLVTVRGILLPVRRLARQVAAWDGESRPPALESSGLAELRQLQEAFAALAGRLADYRQRIQAAERQTMSRFVVHEVRNALTPISLGLRSLKDGPDQSRAARSVALMEASLAGLETLLEQLRCLYAGRPAAVQACLLDPVLAGLPAARDRRVVLPEPAGLAVWADPALLGMAVDNLVRNALQALDAAGTPDGRVELRLEPASPGQVLLWVRDNGPGIAPRDRQRLFTEYFTTKQKGMGLGLAFARQMVEAFGGSLELSAAGPAGPGPGEPVGACFELRLPQVAPEGTGEPAGTGGGMTAGTISQGGSDGEQ